MIPYAGMRSRRPAAGRRPGRSSAGSENVPDTAESPVTSVDRALRIMALAGGAARGISLDELAARLDIPKSSLHRILAALKYRRFISQPEDRKSTRLNS